MSMRLTGALSILLLAAACGSNQAGLSDRDQIMIAGSSTVNPFVKAVADRYKAGGGDRAEPTVEATGTGPGIERFCGGVGGVFPDVVGASRRMEAAEYRRCAENGVNEIVELEIGMDGIVFAQSPSARPLALTRKQIYEALAANPYGEPQTKRVWRDVDPSLPDSRISVLGPPAADGTRDSLVELIMLPGCEADPRMARLKAENAARFTEVCTTIRSDGVYEESGEDDERTSMMLVADPRTVGIFGYSYLEAQGPRLRAIALDGVAPDGETIASRRYLGARPLYVYVKRGQVDQVPGLRDYLAELVRGAAPGAYLAQAGLIPGPDEARQRLGQAASQLTPMQGAGLQ